MLLLGGVFLTLWPRQAAAQASTITWDISPGFNGSYRSGAWFPIEVTLSNSGPDLRGTLELRFREGQTATFSQMVELPHNARKQIVLPVVSSETQSGELSAHLVLRSDGAIVRQEQINLNAYGSFTRVIGVISDEGGALPELEAMVPAELGNGQRLSFTSADLPERAEFLQTFTALFVHSGDIGALSSAQRAALQIWISSGGQLVVGGDPQVARGLGELLPATFEETGDQSSLRNLGVETGWTVRNPALAVPVLRLTPTAGAQVELRGDGDLPLVVRRQFGLGQVLMTSFALDAVREAGDAARFWPTVVRLNVDQQVGWTGLRAPGREILEGSLDLPGLRLPSPLALLGFLLLYILVVGPLNYLLLRRLQRREWAYFTVPLVVLLFSGGAYVWGTIGRGSSATVTGVSVVQVLPEATRGQATTLLAVFSPTRRSYSVETQPEALVANLEQQWANTAVDLDIVFDESAVRVPELLVDVGGVRTLSAEHSVDVPQLEISRSADREVTIRNRSGQPIEALALVDGSGLIQMLPALEPGQEHTVDFKPDSNASNFGVSPDGTLDRDAVFRHVSSALLPSPITFAPREERIDANGLVPFDPASDVLGTTSSALPDPMQALYVVGWQSQPTLPVTLNGQPNSSTGQVLYIWPVGEE